ncbi:hypothetical protein [Marichromatium bheemlicum]|uniref:Uncharacterized protein n=1 Tax=Marichromatium bheemlicum TaxID=365339 RepID=A0ABX1I2T0_9GAMM|nr:hypothetical protein [Marichromatium bheemlicum]NKN31762.1 hypothetical protein [Marichromatium bheemlicum]
MKQLWSLFMRLRRLDWERLLVRTVLVATLLGGVYVYLVDFHPEWWTQPRGEAPSLAPIGHVVHAPLAEPGGESPAPAPSPVDPGPAESGPDRTDPVAAAERLAPEEATSAVVPPAPGAVGAAAGVLGEEGHAGPEGTASAEPAVETAAPELSSSAGAVPETEAVSASVGGELAAETASPTVAADDVEVSVGAGGDQPTGDEMPPAAYVVDDIVAEDGVPVAEEANGGAAVSSPTDMNAMSPPAPTAPPRPASAPWYPPQGYYPPPPAPYPPHGGVPVPYPPHHPGPHPHPGGWGY